MSPLKILSNLVEIPSEYPNEAKIGDYVFKQLKNLGFESKKQAVSEKRYNIIAQKGKGEEFLIFGHLDTVGNQDGWRTNPFRITRQGDKLFGLGSWDMKGGLAAILNSLNSFNPNKFCLKIAFVVDEEDVSLGMHKLIQSGWLNNVRGAITSEPGFLHGLRGIALGRIGRSVYKMTISTQGGHVYLTDKQPNAISEFIKISKVIEDMKKVNHPLLGDSAIFIRYVAGGAQSMSIPSEVVAEIETQLVPPQTPDSVLEQIINLISKIKKEGKIKADIKIEVVKRKTPFCKPYIFGKTHPFIQKIATTLENTTTKKPIYYYRRSVSDENRVAEIGIPVVTIGPEGGNAHQPNEWVSEASLIKLSKFYSNLLNSLDKETLF